MCAGLLAVKMFHFTAATVYLSRVVMDVCLLPLRVHVCEHYKYLCECVCMCECVCVCVCVFHHWAAAPPLWRHMYILCVCPCITCWLSNFPQLCEAFICVSMHGYVCVHVSLYLSQVLSTATMSVDGDSSLIYRVHRNSQENSSQF